ncbi:uncharacterized protein LOC142323487 isoform X2 [Lycorma delicatula]|uniref:uncharacterized protein LOC142323487 isoform X2 n=1 Tax=Lycorma delicatula TaxID=130591 RepID=UPI003F50FF5B
MRSSIRLKSSFTSGHSDLNMIISDLKEVKSTAKAFMLAQQTAWRDISKWASKEHNSTISSSLTYFMQLSDLWTDVQSEFLEQVSKFKYQFDMILEGEQRIDKMREHLGACELRESKYKKELKKASQKGTVDDVQEIETKIAEAKSLIKVAQIEITERLNENEATKAVRMKEGLSKLSDGYLDIARKSFIIFQAQKEVCSGLPDRSEVEGRGIQDMQYNGSEQAKQAVYKAIEYINLLKKQSPYSPGAPSAPGPPPGPSSPPPPPYSPSSQVFRNSWQQGYRCDIGFTQIPPPVHYSLPPDRYEQDLAGAVIDRARISN